MDAPAVTSPPIAIVAYNRPGHLARLLASIERCRGFEGRCVRVFADGLGKSTDEEAWQKTRELAREWSEKTGAECVFFERNHGVADAIYRATSRMCAEHGRALILEDDLVLHPDALEFHAMCLDRYADDGRVFQVSGHQWLDFRRERGRSPIALPMTTTWGWSTWRRAWEGFDMEQALEAGRKFTPEQIAAFNLGGAYDYYAIFKGRAVGDNHSWGILWYVHAFLAGGVTIYPSFSLIRNEGFDNSGVHCTEESSVPLLDVADWRAATIFPLKVTPRLKIDRPCLKRIQKLFRGERVERSWFEMTMERLFKRRTK
jgi:hypothetical protein